MIARTWPLVLALMLTASACGPAGESRTEPTPVSRSAPATTMNADLTQRLDGAVDRVMVEAGIPGAIIGIWGPDGEYVRAFGVADTKTRAPMKTDFYTRIGSQTKAFTVTAILHLADRGRVGLDDPIAGYVQGVPRGEEITLRQLAGMRSGLPNYSANPAFQQARSAAPRRHFTPKELLGFAFAQPAAFTPGEGYEHTNTDAVLLGLVVEKVTGEPLPDYIHSQILEPLGMRHTSFPADSSFPKPHAEGYTHQIVDGRETTATGWNPSSVWAAGAMISTLHDLRIWAPALATGKLLTPEMHEQRLAQDGYGLGLFDLGGWIGHNGSLPGYQTVAVYLPERRLALVILINTDIPFDGAEPGTLMATALTRELTPDHVYTFD